MELRRAKSKQGAELCLGDIIKLGRIEFRVSEMQFFSPESEELVQVKLTSAQKQEEVKIVKKVADPTGKECRICLMEDSTEEDFFINPCQCKGSSGTFHYHCFKRWFERKIPSKTSTNVITFSWKKLECEVCKDPISKKIKIQDKEHEVIPMERPTVPFLVLERLPRDKNDYLSLGAGPILPSGSSFISLLSFPFNDPINIGRGHQCNLRVSDISVSRHHATITYQNGRFLLLDNKSKFGTLILMNKPYEITQEKIAVQVGRTVLSFSVKQHFIQPISMFPHENDPNPRTNAHEQGELDMDERTCTHVLEHQHPLKRRGPLESRSPISIAGLGRDEPRSSSLEVRPLQNIFDKAPETIKEDLSTGSGAFSSFYGSGLPNFSSQEPKTSFFVGRKQTHISSDGFQTRNFGEEATINLRKSNQIGNAGAFHALVPPDELNEILTSFNEKPIESREQGQNNDLNLSFGIDQPKKETAFSSFGLSSGVRGGFFNNELTKDPLGEGLRRKGRNQERATTPPSSLGSLTVLLGSRRASSDPFLPEDLMETNMREVDQARNQSQAFRRARLQNPSNI